jgi:SAM-dependent methyltransferase
MNDARQADPADPPYDVAYHDTLVSGSVASARIVVPLVLELAPARSVIDVGCGAGSWASVFREQGIEDVVGVDGEGVSDDQLLIPRDTFVTADLAQTDAAAPLPISRRFDLCVSLEVAEHLDESRADAFVRTLTDLADVVLFSAATPRQGGTHHVNEQWQDYWARRFRTRSYLPIDCIRPKIWSRDDVEVWYRQNIILYATPGAIESSDALRAARARTNDAMLSLAHPFLFDERTRPPAPRPTPSTRRAALRDLARAARRLLKGD